MKIFSLELLISLAVFGKEEMIVKRESKYELLRITLTFMVITLHYLNSEMGRALEYTRTSNVNYALARFLKVYVLLQLTCLC